MALGILRRSWKALSVPTLSSSQRVLAFGWSVSISRTLNPIPRLKQWM